MPRMGSGETPAERAAKRPAVRRRAPRSGKLLDMTVIKINALTVPAEMGEEVARRFAARVGAVDGSEGASEGGQHPPAMPIQAELWSYEVSVASGG